MRLAALAILCATVAACAERCETASGVYVSPVICEEFKAAEARRAARTEAANAAPATKPDTSGPTVPSGEPEEQTGSLEAGETSGADRSYRVQVIRDKHGIRQGTLERRPDGEIVIKDRWGIRQGTIGPAR
jgi:hypothetical protein